MTFAALYVYGHLLAIAFSLSVALACTAVALRVPSARKDLALSGVYLLIAVTTALEMWMALRPSIAAGRLYLICGGSVLLGLVATFHQHYDEVLTPERRRLYQLAIGAVAAYGAILLGLFLWGVLDRGHLNLVRLWGAHSGLPAMSIGACLACAAFSFANVPLCVEIYRSDRPSAKARWLVSSGIWLGPLVAAWDLSICAGLNPWLPFGGYLAALVSIEGAVQLVERLRTLPQSVGSIGGYRLEQRLGTGGMAEVYFAVRRPMGGTDRVVQRVALKRMRTEHADDPHFVRMFLDEARILARLSHPNIVQLLDAGSDHGTLFLAMELVDGATVQQIFRGANTQREKLSAAVVVEVGLQLCAALESAHKLTGEDGRPLELIHRDISPQNVLVDRHGTVKLSDFGIARSADRLTETATGLIKGKMSYMAPEQIQGKSYDQRVDLYAVGVILFELLTGERLYKSVSDAELLYEILEGRRQRLQLLAERAPRLEKIIRAALDPDPEQRPASAAAMRHELALLREDPRGTQELAEWVKLATELRRQAEGEPPRSQEPGATTATRARAP